MTRESCSQQCRSLFEEAARAHHGGDSGVAGEKLGEAQVALYNCLGITPNIDLAFEEVERWFSFFGLWWSARLLEQGKAAEAWDILTDQAESYSPSRALALGITQDYGIHKVEELYQGTMHVLELIQESNLPQAATHADVVADIQYQLAVERVGIASPDLGN